MKIKIMLTDEQILATKKTNEELTFPRDFDLVYERQFFPGVVILLEGELQFVKTTILKSVTKRGSVIGWENILLNKKSKHIIRVKAGSRILFIGRSGIDEFQKITL